MHLHDPILASSKEPYQYNPTLVRTVCSRKNTVKWEMLINYSMRKGLQSSENNEKIYILLQKDNLDRSIISPLLIPTAVGIFTTSLLNTTTRQTIRINTNVV